MLYVDIPTQTEIAALVQDRHAACVSIYVETTPLTQNIGAARIAFGNLSKLALSEAADRGLAKDQIASLSRILDDIREDDDFWRYQANSLAVFVTPDTEVSTFRLPSRLSNSVHVSDRFHVKPLLRAVTFPNHAFVLALEEKGPRLIEVFADLPAREVRLSTMPQDAGDATRRASVNDRSASGRIHGDEGQKVLLRQFASKIDMAISPKLSGRDEPLVLAGVEPLLSIYRSVSTYPHLAAQAITGSPSAKSPAELADEARSVMNLVYEARVQSELSRFDALENEGRATTDIAQAARAASAGAIDTLLVDIDADVPGSIDDEGRVTFADTRCGDSYGIVDEIAGRTLLAGGRIVAVRASSMRNGASLAAILRYAV